MEVDDRFMRAVATVVEYSIDREYGDAADQVVSGPANLMDHVVVPMHYVKNMLEETNVPLSAVLDSYGARLTPEEAAEVDRIYDEFVKEDP